MSEVYELLSNRRHFRPQTQSLSLLVIHGHIVRIIELAKVSRPKRVERGRGTVVNIFQGLTGCTRYVRGKKRGYGEEKIKYG